jgi:hypothetical protein
LLVGEIATTIKNFHRILSKLLGPQPIVNPYPTRGIGSPIKPRATRHNADFFYQVVDRTTDSLEHQASPTFRFNSLAHNLNLDDLEQAEQRKLVLVTPRAPNLAIFESEHTEDGLDFT